MTNEREDRLMTEAARLQQSVSPGRDLWPGIEAAITEPAPRRRPWLAQAAGVLVLVAASSLITYTLTVNEPDVTPVAVGPELRLAPASFGGGHELGNGYKLAKVGLEAQLERELAMLPPEQRAEIEENLQIIQGAIAEINAELEKNPDSALLQDLLLKTYREELAVMRNVGGLAQSIMSRNDI